MSIIGAVFFYWFLLSAGGVVGYFWSYSASQLTGRSLVINAAPFFVLIAIVATVPNPAWAIVWLVGVLIGFSTFGLMDAASVADEEIDGDYDGW